MSFIRGYYRLSLSGLILTFCAVFIVLTSYLPITIFPEGKRGPGGALLPFRHGAFEIVTLGGFAFLPIAVTFSNLEIAIWHRKENFLKALWRLARQPERIEVTLMPLEAHHPTPEDDPVALAKKVQAQLTAVLYPDQVGSKK